MLRAFAERTGTPEPALHVYVSDPPTLLDEKLPIVRRRSRRRRRMSPAKRPPRSSGGPAPMPCISPPTACPAWRSAPAGACIRTRAVRSMHAFGEHVLVDDCVAAARIYLATALDLCSRKAA